MRYWTYEEEAVAKKKKKTQLCLNILSQETEWLTRRFLKFEKMVRMLAWDVVLHKQLQDTQM